MKIFYAIGLAFATLATILLFAFVWAFLIRWAWNTLMPYLFNLKEIDYWQAYAFSVLAGSFGGRGIHQEIKN